MTGEQVARALLEHVGLDPAVYRMGFNKVEIENAQTNLLERILGSF